MKKEDLTGQIFSEKLTVIREAIKDSKKRGVKWICKCICGNETIVAADKLKSGHTKSCGCYNLEKSKERGHLISKSITKYTPQESSMIKVHQNRYNDMNFELFKEMCKLPCFYCGIELSNLYTPKSDDPKCSEKKNEEGKFYYNGIDRIDNNLGHIEGNVVPACKHCNSSKREFTIKEFYEWIIAVNNNLENFEYLLNDGDKNE